MTETIREICTWITILYLASKRCCSQIVCGKLALVEDGALCFIYSFILGIEYRTNRAYTVYTMKIYLYWKQKSLIL